MERMEQDRSAVLASIERLLVLSDRRRVAVLSALLDGPHQRSELESRFRMSRRLLSEHLRALVEAGFIRAGRRGNRVVYTLALPMLAGTGGRGLDLGWCKLMFGQGTDGNA